MGIMNRRAVLFAMAMAGAMLSPSVVRMPEAASATGIGNPTERVVLTVSGKIAVSNGDGVARFDMPMLEALGITRIETMTPWYPNKVVFEGVRLDKLMTLLGANGTLVTAVALNDYSADIPLADFAAHGTILSVKRDGQYMSVREKGPLFIVYPFDADPSLKSERYYSRSVWQVKELVVK